MKKEKNPIAEQYVQLSVEGFPQQNNIITYLEQVPLKEL